MGRRIGLRTVLTSMALLGVSVPAASANTQVISSTVKIFNEAEVGYEADVTSRSERCVGGRQVVISDGLGAEVEVVTAPDGGFEINSGEFGIVDDGVWRVAVQRSQRFGPRGKRKRCGADTATISYPATPVSFSAFTFNDSTNTFSGTLASDKSACTDIVEVQLYLDFEDLQATDFTSSTGAFAFTLPGEPQPGAWDAINVGQASPADFESDGDVVVPLCGLADSDEIVISAR